MKQKGHYAPPGTGPKGETCKTCKYYYRREFSKAYLKCWLTRHNWTCGPASDIKASSPACLGWRSPDYDGPDPTAKDVFLELFNDR